jgi:septal ring factor EnvC (AmiA/AmiB activator)
MAKKQINYERMKRKLEHRIDAVRELTSHVVGEVVQLNDSIQCVYLDAKSNQDTIASRMNTGFFEAAIGYSDHFRRLGEIYTPLLELLIKDMQADLKCLNEIVDQAVVRRDDITDWIDAYEREGAAQEDLYKELLFEINRTKERLSALEAQLEAV